MKSKSIKGKPTQESISAIRESMAQKSKLKLKKMKVQEGETLCLEKISKENRELRDAIKRQTVELEHKNRELEIESALERVRAKALAMHSSADLAITVDTFFSELIALNVMPHRCGMGIIDAESKTVDIHATTFTDSKEIKKITGKLKLSGHPVLDSIYENWQLQKEYHPVLRGNEIIEYYKIMNPQVLFPDFAGDEIQFGYYFFFKEGGVYAWTDEELTERDLEIFRRYNSVLSLTYRRYIDLKEAEAQAREAQIEAALERVRSKTMAMHNSNDVGVTVVTLFDEVLNLGLDKSIRVGIGILEGNEGMETWSATSNPEGEVDLKMGMLDMTIHPMLIGLKKAWKSGKTCYSYDYIGEDVFRYYKALNNEPEYPFQADLDSLPENEYHKSFFYSEGILFSFAPNPISEEAAKVLDRFARVFGQTYRRYLDLQKAEEQAREALKQASLDRVRGQIASMRSTSDLQHITPLIWSELEILEVPFNRCGVFILDEIKANVQVYLTTPDGKPLGILNLPFDANELTINMVEYWRKKKVYTQHWNKEDFIKWMESMINMGQIQTREEYQGDTKPPESLDLHFIPFMQGMLYVGNSEPLLPEKIELVKTLAEAFSIAYARYEDFIHLEEAKNQIENTLTELKSTQGQLIHAEKMASLGELTAGIAHEIQNPLNFVNNFSDVSVDLIEEMDEEMASGNTEEVKAIAGDLKQNLEKITLHGKRASLIVRGMLEHSRTNTGDKKPTDINILADEFLRLSYHGLRAKDKSFNAEFKTEFDEDLPKINVIPQDFGRVFLNLFNNAFYAVAEKQKQQPVNYNPLVVISTNIKESKLEIKVSDNGNGIPSSVKDKIFQPFFTTKPTGDGTGLGLSLSYDIISKGHNGELTVNTKEGEGTEFIIVLPEI